MSTKRTSKTTKARKRKDTRRPKPTPAAPPVPPKIGLVCAYRNETDLENTLASARLAACGEIMTVYRVEDHASRGPGFCRHAGIVQATADGCDVIVIIDAHMRFQAGLLSGMAAAVRADRQLLLCAPCCHNSRCGYDDKVYRGSRFTLRAETIHGETGATERCSLAAQWTGPEEQCNAVMGACYAFDPAMYARAGSPLRMLHSWGGDEEYLSACFWFAGGHVSLYDRGEICAHLARDKSTADPGMDLQAGIWTNRLQLLRMLPLAPDMAAELTEWTRSSTAFTADAYREAIDARLNVTETECYAVRDLLASYGRDPAEWLAQARPYSRSTKGNIVSRPDVVERAPPHKPPAAPKNDVTQIVERAAEVCGWCGADDPFLLTAGMRRVSDRAAVGRARCRLCGHKAKIVKSY